MKELFMIVTVIIITIVVGIAGIYGYTYIERKVFEQSYQRQEGLKAEIATYEASLVEIEALLHSDTVDQAKRELLENQRTAIIVRLNAAKRRLQQ